MSPFFRQRHHATKEERASLFYEIDEMVESEGCRCRWGKVLRELEKGGPDPSFSFLFKMGKAKMRKEQLRGWNDRYNQLLEYKAEHKNCLVPARYSKNKALGKWVNNQRTQYRLRSEGEKSHLTEARIKLLMESQWQLLGRPLQPASRIQERAQELPGPQTIPQEQGPRDVGPDPAEAVPSQKRGGEEPPHRGTDQAP